MDILIAGAGIGGLATALSLHAAGFDSIRIVDAAPDIQPIGVGLNVLPNAVRELTDLGLYDQVASNAIPTRELALFNRQGSRIWDEPRGRAAGYLWPQFSIQRGYLQRVLLEAVHQRLGPATIRAGACVTTFRNTPDGRVEVKLRDPAGGVSTMDADLLIGADGVHSGVRAVMFPDEGPPNWNGMVMYRGTTWAQPYLGGATMAVLGDDVRRMVFYPIARHPEHSDTVLVNWVAGVPGSSGEGDWQRTAPRDEVVRQFADWRVDWLDIGDILARAMTVYEYPMIDRDPLPSWTLGRVTLLGDAAHAMFPMGSNGATQAIIDARVLAYQLAAHNDIDDALEAYESARRPPMTELQLSNRKQGPEAVITLVHRRAPDGFTNLDDVIDRRELEAVSARYASIAGFDVHTVNTRESLNVPGRGVALVEGEQAS